MEEVGHVKANKNIKHKQQPKSRPKRSRTKSRTKQTKLKSDRPRTRSRSRSRSRCTTKKHKNASLNVINILGLPGAGKTTLMNKILEKIQSRLAPKTWTAENMKTTKSRKIMGKQKIRFCASADYQVAVLGVYQDVDGDSCVTTANRRAGTDLYSMLQKTRLKAMVAELWRRGCQYILFEGITILQFPLLVSLHRYAKKWTVVHVDTPKDICTKRFLARTKRDVGDKIMDKSWVDKNKASVANEDWWGKLEDMCTDVKEWADEVLVVGPADLDHVVTRLVRRLRPALYE